MAGCGPANVETATPTLTVAPYQVSSPSPTSLPATPVRATVPPLAPTSTPFVHEVAKDDTLLQIAAKYGVTLDQLLAANPGIDPHFLTVGQRLNIPGPNGEPSAGLLPTSTPIPLSVSPARCFPTRTSQVECLVTITNTTATSVEGISAQLSLFDPSGSLIDSQMAYAPLGLVPSGGHLTLAGSFATAVSGVGADATLATAVEVGQDSGRYVPVKAVAQNITYASDRRSAGLQGSVTVTSPGNALTWQVTVVATAVDAAGDAVGYATWRSSESDSSATDQIFSLDLYSLGPRIDHIDLLADARVLTLKATRTP